MPRYAIATFLIAIAISSNSVAQENLSDTLPANLTNTSPLRLELSVGKTSSVAKLNTVEVGTKSSDRFGTLTFHFRSQIFGEVGYGRPTLHETSVNGETLPRQTEADPTLAIYGLGFRSYRKRSDGEFLGIAMRYASSAAANENSNSSRTLRIFSQKDTFSRYRVLQLSREYGDLGDINKISGKHVWFTSGGIGFGFHWALGMGRDIQSSGSEIEYRTRDAGILIMYRPKLHKSKYSYGDEYMDEDFLTETDAHGVTYSDSYNEDEFSEDELDEFSKDELESDEFSEDDFDEDDFADDEFSEDEFGEDEFADDEFSEDSSAEDNLDDSELLGDEFSDEANETEATDSMEGEETISADESSEELADNQPIPEAVDNDDFEEEDDFDEEFESSEWIEG